MYNLANNAWSRLASSVGANDTTITVASAILFPEPPFVVSIADEILEVTSVSGNTFTVVRGVEGTSSSSYLQGERVDARFTAGVYGGLKDTILNHLEDTDNPHNLLADLIPFSPADPASDWEPTKVADALDILAGSRIVEYGSNANGKYWRWENGLQICMLSFDVILLSDVLLDEMYEYEKLGENVPLSEGSYGALRWNYPAQFSEIPYGNAQFVGRNQGTLSYMSTAVRFHRLRELNYIDLDVRHSGGLLSTGPSYMLVGGLMAVGRWK